MHSILTQLRQQTNSFYSWINVFIFWVSVQSHVLGPISQSNALYDMALLQGFGSVYSWLIGPCMLKGVICLWLMLNNWGSKYNLMPQESHVITHSQQHLSDIFVDVRCCHLNSPIMSKGWGLLGLASTKIIFWPC